MITTRDLSLIRVRPAVPPVAPDAPAPAPAFAPATSSSAGGDTDTVAGAPEDGVEIVPRS